MKKLFIILIFTMFSSAYADGHITKKQKQEVIQCVGHYTATGVIPTGSIDLKNLEMALASAKVVRTFLQNEKVSDDEINKGMIEYVDKVFGKPFDNSVNNKCNKFIYKLIPGSKEEVEKLSRTIYGG